MTRLLTFVLQLLVGLAILPPVHAKEYAMCKKPYGCGLVDETGHPVLPGLYQSIQPFEEGSAIFRDNNRWGMLGYDGKKLADLGYLRPVRLPGGYVYSKSNGSLYNRKGEIVLRKVSPVENDSRYIKEKNQYFLHSKGEVKNYYKLNGSLVASFSSTIDKLANLTPVQQYIQEGTEHKGLWGYVNKDLSWVIQPKFQNAHDFDRGVAVVETENGCQLINEHGEPLHNFYFKECYHFYGEDLVEAAVVTTKYNRRLILRRNGTTSKMPSGIRILQQEWQGPLALVEVNNGTHGNLYGAMDQNGKMAIKPIYKSLEFTDQGFVIASDYTISENRKITNQRFGLFNNKGKMLLPIKYSDLKKIPGHRLFFSSLPGKSSGIMKDSGKYVVPADYHDYEWLSQINSIALENSDGWKIFRPNGKLLPYPTLSKIDNSSPEIPLISVEFPYDAAKRVSEDGFIAPNGRLFMGRADISMIGLHRAPYYDYLSNRYGVINFYNGSVDIPPKYGAALSAVDESGFIIFDAANDKDEPSIVNLDGRVYRFSQIWPEAQIRDCSRTVK